MMRGNDVIGILFAYVHEERVRELTQNRVMASVPYGGRYRLVDFPLSNMVNSGINKVGVITEQNYQSLMDHLGSGKAWDLSRKREGLYLLPPFGAETMRTEGKISSLASIMRFLKNSHEEYVLLSDCDTVANIDYKEVFQLHTEKNATSPSCTVMELPPTRIRMWFTPWIPKDLSGIWWSSGAAIPTATLAWVCA